MTSSYTNIVQIIESDTELGANKRISRWFKFSCNTIWLETIDSSSNEFNIVSPSSYNWISFYRCTRNSCSCETLFITFPSFSKCYLFSFSNTFSNERIFTITIRITASCFCLRVSPIIVFTYFTLSS
jgi:hypothetical protein